MTQAQITQTALKSFWEAVQKACPHMTSIGGGSVPFEEDAVLQVIAEKSIAAFISKNDRDRWTKIGTVVVLEFDSDAPFDRKKLLGFVWGSDHETFRTFANVRLHDWSYRKYGFRQQIRVDPGLVRVEFDRDHPDGWRMYHGPNLFRVKISAPENAWTVSVAANYRQGFVEVRETVEISDIPLMQVPMPLECSSADRENVVLSVTRLAAEINMERFSKMNWEGTVRKHVDVVRMDDLQNLVDADGEVTLARRSDGKVWIAAGTRGEKAWGGETVRGAVDNMPI